MKTHSKTKDQANEKSIAKQTQIINEEVEKSYTLIIDKARDLLKRFEGLEFRSYCEIDHTKNEQNTNLVKEFLCYFWNITIYINLENGRYFIQIDMGKEELTKFGNGLTNLLFSEVYRVIQANGDTAHTENNLLINFKPLPMLNYYYSIIARGETEYINISTVETDTE